MTSSHQKPTLLIFTLGPCRENLRKSLLPGGLSAAEYQLHQAGLDVAIEAGRSSGCRVVVAAPRGLALPRDVQHLSQQGDCFSSRLRNAVRVLQEERPGTPVVVVGTDVPNLAADHIRAALLRVAVKPKDVVLGPCPDGGFYLLATRQPIDRVLSQVKWCRRDTLASLIDALHSQSLSTHLLSPLRDLDRSEDLELWLAHDGSGLIRGLVYWLLELLADFRRPLMAPRLGWPLSAMTAAPTGRGPPA
jgi:2-phospho-L-lactate guanylyltransferase (CobY/MobA/RfbA family)